MLGDTVMMASMDTRAIDLALVTWQLYNEGQAVLFEAGLITAGAKFATYGAGAIFRFAQRGGHHIIPRWAGGSIRQLLHRPGALKHLDELEPTIRRRMREKFGINITGRGNTRDYIMEIIHREGIQGQVFDELLDVYRNYDMLNGTNLTGGFWANVMGGLYKPL